MMDRAELKALIREVLAEVQEEGERVSEEQRHISEYYAAEAAERSTKREARARAEAEDERCRLEDRVYDLERKGWGR